MYHISQEDLEITYTWILISFSRDFSISFYFARSYDFYRRYSANRKHVDRVLILFVLMNRMDNVNFPFWHHIDALIYFSEKITI